MVFDLDKDFDLIEKCDSYKVFLSKNKEYKLFISAEANYVFNLKTGKMSSWGKTQEEDPIRFPAPNILDLEVTTICKKGCPFCYKSNNPNGKNMSLETFKKIVDVLPKSITQIAFGADYDASSNLELFSMMYYAKMHNIVPNITVGYLDDLRADLVSSLCGACAVSVYDPKDKAYDTVKKLTDRGMKQVNIHCMISEETYNRAMEIIYDSKTDPRLSKLNAIVFLSLKKKGRGTGYHPLSQEQFNNLVSYANEMNIGIGFDSCSSLKAYRALPDQKDNIIPCEASTESSYINVNGEYFPCSFMEGEIEDDLNWLDGLSVLECNSTEDFLNKVWNNKKTIHFSNRLNNTCKDNPERCKHCPYFEV